MPGRCLFGFLLLFPPLVLSGCDRGKEDAKQKPDEEPPAREESLAEVVLTDEMERSIGLEVAELHAAVVSDSLETTGWVMPRQGRLKTIVAPIAGFVHECEGDAIPIPGAVVRTGQRLFELQPVLGPAEQLQVATAGRDVEKVLVTAKSSMDATATVLERKRELYQRKLASVSEVQTAQLAYDEAKAEYESALEKRKLFAAIRPGERPQLEPLPIVSPLGGVVLSVAANPGEFVAGSAVLVTVADLSTVWIRVPVFERDLSRVRTDTPALVLIRGANSRHHAAEPGQAPNGNRPQHASATEDTDDVRSAGLPTFALRPAKPIVRVPVVHPVERTADLIFELTNADGALSKDQMVRVHLPLDAEVEQVLAPASAIVSDAFGGSWLYIESEPHEYVRKRVELGPTVDGKVVILRGVQPGQKIVVTGAAELWGQQFQSAKAD